MRCASMWWISVSGDAPVGRGGFSTTFERLLIRLGPASA